MNSLLLRGALLLTASVATLPVATPSAPGPTPAPPRCTYPGMRADTRELLLLLDRELPRAVALARADLRRRGETYYLRDVWLDSCFRQMPLKYAYYGGEHLETALRRQLTHYYVKPLEPRYDDPHVFNLQVLEYVSDEAATAAKHLQDSTVMALQAQCQHMDHKLEPCQGIEHYRVSRRRNCLVRRNIYSQDPTDRGAMHQVVSNLRY